MTGICYQNIGNIGKWFRKNDSWLHNCEHKGTDSPSRVAEAPMATIQFQFQLSSPSNHGSNSNGNLPSLPVSSAPSNHGPSRCSALGQAPATGHQDIQDSAELPPPVTASQERFRGRMMVESG